MFSGAGILSLPAAYLLAELLVCAPSAAPEVVVKFKNTPPQLDQKKSSQDLARMQAHSTSPIYGTEFPIIGGLTASEFQISYGMQFANISYPSLGQVCIHPKTIEVTLTYTPVIYVASDYPPGSCQYGLTEEHETRHVSVDVITATGFLPQIKQAASFAVSQWRGTGPVHESQMEAVQNGLLKQLSAPMKKQLDQFQQTRRLRQQAVDSREEYRRLSEACPHERLR